MNNTCPVCGNQGIPAYHSQDVVCPRCGSDLRIYRTIAEASQTKQGGNKYKRFAIILPIIVFVMLCIPVSVFYFKNVKTQQALIENQKEISFLKDSLSVMSVQLNEARLQNVQVVGKEDYTKYEIVHNDSPWKIVYKFYGIRGDWKELAKQIAEDNGIWNETIGEWKPIYPGQILKIYNN